MADCTYSRCIQQKRNIRRELQRWTKNMVYIVGLERIAEELMGRRKWKLYQESMSRNYLQPLNNNVKRAGGDSERASPIATSPEPRAGGVATPPTTTTENGDEEAPAAAAASSENGDAPPDAAAAARTTPPADAAVAKEEPRDVAAAAAEDQLKDWSPPTKCYFCVDGKLDSEHNNHGPLSPRHSDSDSSDSRSDAEPPTLSALGAGHHHHHHHHHHPHHPHQQHHQHHHQTTQQNARRRALSAVEQNMAVIAAAVTGALGGGGGGAGGGGGGGGGVGGATPSPHLAALYPPFYAYARDAAAAAAVGDVAASERTPAAGDEPLDLSSKSAATAAGGAAGNGTTTATTAAAAARILDPEKLFASFDARVKGKMPPVVGRRTYTEDELQAALRDIQSGKLGTRRAAVIYGIPRSTLRNKVYKLALERERESHLNPVTLKLDEDDPMDDDKDLSGAEEEKEVEKALKGPLISIEDILRLTNLGGGGADALQRNVGPYLHGLLQQGGAPDPKPQIDPDPILREVLRKIIVEEKLRPQPHHHQHHQQHQQQQQHNNNGDSEKQQQQQPPRPSPSNSAGPKNARSESDMETEEPAPNVILKIPSFKPTAAPIALPKNGCDAVAASPPVSESASPPIQPKMSLKDVKDAIAKSICVKFQQPDPRFPIAELEMKTGFTPPLAGIPIAIQKPPPPPTEIAPRPAYQPPPAQPPKAPSNPATTTASTGTTGGKGTRPKRGKYRNYDRDSLVEAVRAVQRGEMSVHRAGSYYGVPHSTLEYKVKERHLMRPRKRDPKPNPVDEKIASLKQNDLRNAEKFKANPPPHLKTLQRLPPTSPNGRMPIIDPNCPIQYPPPFPFWHNFSTFPPAAAFPTNPEQYYASQMMQKLQEESSRTAAPHAANIVNPMPPTTLPKNTRQIAESLLTSGANGSFLDGIIRSSLESGVPTSEDDNQTATKEDGNSKPENMSNKALLDQLCRNSRLTPLPKMSEPSSSSGDEAYRKGTSPKSDASSSKEVVHAIVESSNESSERVEEVAAPPKPPPGRIYLKTELANPDNLKPEMLVRFRDVLHDVEQRNGVVEGAADGAGEMIQD